MHIGAYLPYPQMLVAMKSEMPESSARSRRLYRRSMYSGSVAIALRNCCFDKDATHAMGIAKDGAGFREIRKSQRYHAFRKAILTNRSGIDMCRNCSEGTQVWA